ncbi:MAG: damage-inducible protein DinB [Balneolaceae bacterium]|nr:damage-inducible protein DinB [Balneolaceae bacterium]
MQKTNTQSITITPDELFNHWQGHRRLTRKVIEAFPEDKLFTHSIGGMRPFSELAMEMITIAGPGVLGMVSGEWKNFDEVESEFTKKKPTTKKELLNLWDSITETIDEAWPKIKEGRFQESELVFETYEGKIWSHLFYFIDNEIHHRGQGYVYLRSLDIEPPYFWER